MVNARVRDKTTNLKPGKLGLETAWDRLKKECGEMNAIANTYIHSVASVRNGNELDNHVIREKRKERERIEKDREG